MVYSNPVKKAYIFLFLFFVATASASLLLGFCRYKIISLPLYLISLLSARVVIICLKKNASIFIRMLETIKFSESVYVRQGKCASREYKDLFVLYREVHNKYCQENMENNKQQIFLQELFEQSSIGFILYDENGSVSFVNNSVKHIFGIRKLVNIKELNRTFPDIVGQIETSRSRKMIQVVREGRQFPLAIYKSNLYINRKQYNLLSVEDVSSEAAVLEHLSYQKILRVLIHEIVNSITPILSISQTVNKSISTLDNSDNQNKSSELVSRSLPVIERQCISLLFFIENFRDFIQQKEMNRSEFPVKDLFDHILQIFSDQFVQNKISVEFQCLNPEMKLSADKILLQHVFSNLVKNAVQAMLETSVSKLSLLAEKENDGRIRFTFIDNGCGIEEPNLDNIFTPFYSTREEGTGLGLSFCRQVILLHGGSLTVKSIPGKGTDFQIVL